MKWHHLFVCLVVFFAWSALAHAKTEFEISPGIGYLTGSNTYEIGNIPPGQDPWGRDSYFPISKLDFLLGTYFATLDAKFTIDKVSISGGIRANITDDAGNMRDYDWGIPYWDEDGDQGPGWYVRVITDGTHEWYDLDVESKSKTEVEAVFWEANIAYQIFSHHYEDRFHKGDMTGYLGIGYEYRNYAYECSLIRQWSPSGIPGHDYLGDGNVGITYDVSYSIPYIEFALADRQDKLNVEISFGYSPYVRAEDKDDHLIRIPGPIYAEGDCTGNSLKCAAAIQYNFTPHWSMKLVFDHLYIRAKGEQDNIIYAGTDGTSSWDQSSWTTDERIISRVSYFTMNVAYRFGLKH